ncbi:MAG: hypothetical protein IJ796_10485 [Lachnospiraceae bacterium]|nr:hypothetical protein [Lachnospiraceae bacterium]
MTAEAESEARIKAAQREAVLEAQTTETEIARREAERTIIQAQAQAQAAQMAGMAEAAVMQAKGYSQKDVLQAEVQKAYAEGIGNMGPDVTSGGGSGIVGDMMGLGVGMAAANAAMNTVAPQIGAMVQGMNPAGQMQSAAGDTWKCSCGNMATGNFCNICGKKKGE